jgi:hypothetical protein
LTSVTAAVTLPSESKGADLKETPWEHSMTKKAKSIQEIVEQSGNQFHCRVLEHFQAKGWATMVSPYYLDGITDKPREVDLIVAKRWPLPKRVARVPQSAELALIVECKFIDSPNAFWFFPRNEQASLSLVHRNTGLPEEVDNTYTLQHHYIKDKVVAKLFDSGGAQEQSSFFKALNQVLHGLIALRSSALSLLKPDASSGAVRRHAIHPVILCNSFDKCYRVDSKDLLQPTPITENFLLEVHYAYLASNGSRMSEYILVDVVSFELLDSFLGSLEKDVKAAAHAAP